MAYKKFDDPAVKVSQAAARGNDAFWEDAKRRALQAIANRVVGSTAGGTAGTGYLHLAGCGTGATAGLAIGNTLVVEINGVYSTCIAQDNLEFPNYGTIGTAASSQVMKFLISTAAGTSGTVTGPGNIVTLSDYTTTALAIAAAKLPELPAGHCALGWVSLVTPVTTAVVIGPSRKTGTTGGTASFTNLVRMPYDG